MLKSRDLRHLRFPKFPVRDDAPERRVAGEEVLFARIVGQERLLAVREGAFVRGEQARELSAAVGVEEDVYKRQPLRMLKFESFFNVFYEA